MHAQDAQHTELLAGLNEPQRTAVQHRDGPLLVIAGPGSGKTRVITRRAAYLVQAGVRPRNILAITFTNKAASEMRERIAVLGVNQGMWVYTFHALGVRLLREFGSLAGVSPGFSIYDESDSIRVVKDALAAERISDAVLKPDVARARISTAKNRLETPEHVMAKADWFDQEALGRVYDAYQQLLRERNAVDFDDLLMRVAIVLRDHPDVAERLNVRFRYVLIDEYQDTNHAQYLIAKHLSQHHGNLCATGDPDQSIYAWRGADIRNILEFERDFPNAVVVRLEQNYRSTSAILRGASRLIAANRHRKHKDLWTERSGGAPIRVWHFRDGDAEAERIAERIVELRAGGRSYDDVAIVYRVNALSRGLEDALRRREIPYRIARGVEFYNRREIRDVLAYLRVLANPADEVALLRIINTPTRGIGATTVERLRTHAAETHQSLIEAVRAADQIPQLKTAAKRVKAFAGILDAMQPLLDVSVSEAVSTVLKLSGLEDALRKEDEDAGEDRLANVQELVSAAMRYEDDAEEPSLSDFLARTALVSDQDAVDEEAGCVILMTLHAAKGLEFPVVFVAGLEHGLLPHERALQDNDVEEERRLCFVGMTRAQDELVLSHVDERMIRGQTLPRSASQFLREIDDGTLAREDHRPAFGRMTADADRGFEPVVDDLPPEEAAQLVPRRRLGGSRKPPRRPTPARDADGIPSSPPPAKYADWTPGVFVEHDRYGVGQLMWIRPTPGQTRAGVRFPRHGEKTLILEYATLRRLERKRP